MSQPIVHTASTAALFTARHVHQHLQIHAKIARRWDRWWQGGIIALTVVAALLAILPCVVPTALEEGVQGYQVGGVLVGLGVFGLISVANRLRDGQDWLTLTAGAIATDRAIYLYRTLLQATPGRDGWLNQQIATIQQQMQEQLQGNWQHPNTSSSPDLTMEETANLLAVGYLQERLAPQLEQAAQQVSQLSIAQKRYQATLLTCAVIGAVLPVLSSTWLNWGAIAAIVGLTLLLWGRIASLSRWLETQSQLVLGLTLLRDYWYSLPPSEHTGLAFFRLVLATEMMIESPYRQMANQVRDSVNLLRNELDLIQVALSQPVPVAIERELQGMTPATIVEQLLESQDISALAETDPDAETGRAIAPSEEPVATATPPGSTAINGKTTPPLTKLSPPSQPSPPPPAIPRGCPHAFVVMPFGRKQGPDGRWIDFNSIYQTLIKPALEDAGFEPFRADEEAVSGDILTDMFQELLLADLVVADLSIDNANVFYELGIRHALRRRGVVHIQAGRAYMPFDIFNVRTIPYHCDDMGCPDVQFIEKDKQALVKTIQATWASERSRVHSPIFNLLSGLPEPERKALRTPQAMGYWQEYTNLQSRIAIAQRQKRIGDVVLLAEEVSNPLIKEDILAEAGKALKTMGNSALALKQYRQGLKINPENITFRCEEAFHLSRLGQADEAIVKLEALLQDAPHCVDATTYLARIYKDLWQQNWVGIADDTERIRIAYEASFLLQKSIESYLRGYRLDQNQYYPGINALTLTALLDHLAGVVAVTSGDADEAAYRNRLAALKGAIQFCLESNLQKTSNDYWAALSLGDLAVCMAESPQQVAIAYRKALAMLWNNKFALQATLNQLELMRQLGFHPEHVQAGIGVLKAELERFERQEQLFARPDQEDDLAKPAQVFLFTGHMIDRPKRPKPRFPADMEAEATKHLEETLDKLGSHSNCTAIVAGLACGGDILFVEACLKRNMRVEVYMPFESSEFIQDSVSFAGGNWVDRFYTILNHPNIILHLQPERLGPVPPGDNPYGRNHRWAFYSTLMHDISRVRLIALWNGQGGDGPGGTADMVQQARQLGGMVEHIDITKFAYWRHQHTTIEQIYQKLGTVL